MSTDIAMSDIAPPAVCKARLPIALCWLIWVTASSALWTILLVLF